ncbi:hypothetical protein KL933_000785 [Ogataea haglerorum]|uniref:Uncharacterized protein n=1 Tax=Ogataea haglerorum TaxID=1937702 RepID=A0AAN6D8W3_9ASCO|nr:uncharacterized protein KL911_004904 [Ogataea haglerorum]KAG7692342.1 hypothetical protein KL915_004773 [Ogataea haglerorum]KAG7703143.1 hypothetical protein KL914_004924 [Ogataea haglerorum]KAG7703266.1 hypothetical protein KL950_004900 [Ogataea haglerorum]KAG7714736.1 hypothetical protein KL949_004572 [Ogataea haglerorum]KAG7714986.1 hypothetical protein KL913_004307 [Ogataea haglerorum]
MIIPQFIAENIQAMMAVSDVCPTELVGNSLYKRDINHTWDDTKNGWNKCMDKKWCKIVAIVGIVIGALLAFWLLSTLFQLICCGVKCVDALCCCFCRGGRRTKTEVIDKEQPAPTSQGNAYTNPNMYYQQNSNPFGDRHGYQQHY